MILDDIIANKKSEVSELKRHTSIDDLKKIISLMTAPFDFKKAVSGPRALIAEVKKASPSAGLISEDFDAAATANKYEEAGADAISVLTDRVYFQGHNDHLKAVKKTVKIPVLRKDFIVDEIQLYESRAIGADAILLIAAALSDEALLRFYGIATGLKMNCLVEVHTKEEMLRVLGTPARIIGINNRDLRSFKVDLSTTLDLSSLVPQNSGHIIVSESGIKDAQDTSGFVQGRINALLVGETLMKAPDIRKKIDELKQW